MKHCLLAWIATIAEEVSENIDKKGAGDAVAEKVKDATVSGIVGQAALGKEDATSPVGGQRFEARKAIQAPTLTLLESARGMCKPAGRLVVADKAENLVASSWLVKFAQPYLKDARKNCMHKGLPKYNSPSVVLEDVSSQ